jgi:hypothetical protein
MMIGDKADIKSSLDFRHLIENIKHSIDALKKNLKKNVRIKPIIVRSQCDDKMQDNWQLKHELRISQRRMPHVR